MTHLHAIDESADTAQADVVTLDYNDALTRILNGTVSGLASLYDVEAPRMLAIAQRMGHSQPGAEQIVRNCFVDVWRRAKRISGSDNIRAWLFSTFREETRRAQTHLPQTQSRTDTCDDTSVLFEKLSNDSALRSALDPLGVGREIILLAYLDGLTYSMLAARSGFAATKIRVLLRGALGTLSTLIETRCAKDTEGSECAILAGEYATGLLDAADRIAVDELRAQDANFDEAIRAWQALFVELNDLPEPIAPTAATWRAISRLVEATPRYRATGISPGVLLRAQNKSRKSRYGAVLSVVTTGVVCVVGLWTFAATSDVGAGPARQSLSVLPSPTNLIERERSSDNDVDSVLAVHDKQARDALALQEKRLSDLSQEVALLAARRDGLAFSVASLEADLARTEPTRATLQAPDTPPVSASLELSETISRSNTAVFMHHVEMDDAYAQRMRGLAETLKAETFEVVDVSAVDFNINKTAVRYFFAEDADKATALLERIRVLNQDLDVRLIDTPQDFSHFRPLPKPGTIEVWLGAPR